MTLFNQPVYLHGNSWRHYATTLPASSSGNYSTLVPARFASLKSIYWLGVSHTPETVAMHTQELNEQRTNYIDGVTEESLIGNLESLKYHLGRNSAS